MDAQTSYTLQRLSPNLVLVLGPASNWVVVHPGLKWLLIDSGYPTDYQLVLDSAQEAGAMGLPEAVLLTHGHIDHLGSALRFATEDVPIFCAKREVPNATGSNVSQMSVATALAKAEVSPLWASWVAHVTESGALLDERLPPDALTIFDPSNGMALPLPGSPLPIPSPGHTPGHTSYLVDDVLVTGDAVITSHPTSTVSETPQMLNDSFHEDVEKAQASAARLSSVPARIVAPGHGPASPFAAVREYLTSPNHSVDVD